MQEVHAGQDVSCSADRPNTDVATHPVEFAADDLHQEVSQEVCVFLYLGIRSRYLEGDLDDSG